MMPPSPPSPPFPVLSGLFALFLASVSAEEIVPHPDAAANTHAPGEVDVPRNVRWIVEEPSLLPGLVLDETDAVLSGTWQYSTHTPPYVGIGYLHDQKSGKGEKSVTWHPDFPETGWYELRVAHCYNVRRSRRALVLVRHSGGEAAKRIDQQAVPEHRALFRTIGVYHFEKGKTGAVKISNEGTEPDKVVIADAIQLLRVKKNDPAPRPVD